jgi:hypothetical protein
LWGEPLNVLSSASYFVAAWAVLPVARRPTAGSTAVRILAILPWAIGAGSVLFHMLATPWARRLDEAPIAVFQFLWLALYARRVLQLQPMVTAAVVAGFATVLTLARLAPPVANGSLPYIPALMVVVVIALHQATTERRFGFAWTALIFAVAIAARAADNAMCAAWPFGTHAIWHVLTAMVVYRFAAFSTDLVPVRLR